MTLDPQVARRRELIREIADELGQRIEEFREYPEQDEFDEVKVRRLNELAPDTQDAMILASITFDDVRKVIYG